MKLPQPPSQLASAFTTVDPLLRELAPAVRVEKTEIDGLGAIQSQRTGIHIAAPPLVSADLGGKLRPGELPAPSPHGLDRTEEPPRNLPGPWIIRPAARKQWE